MGLRQACNVGLLVTWHSAALRALVECLRKNELTDKHDDFLSGYAPNLLP